MRGHGDVACLRKTRNNTHMNVVTLLTASSSLGNMRNTSVLKLLVCDRT
jgi:hypothetical protein